MTIDTDATGPEEFDEFDDTGAEDAFFASLTGAEQPTKKQAPAAPQEAAEGDPELDLGDDAGDEPEATGGAPAATDDPDDAELDVRFGEEARKVKLKDLKAAFQVAEQNRTQAEKLAERQRQVDDQGARAQTALVSLLDRAKERFKPYAELDYLKLSRQLDEASWDQLRKDALAARQDVEFLEGELDSTVKHQREQGAKAYQEAASKAVAVLSGPEDKGGIKGWNVDVYNGIVDYAVAQGVPKDKALAIVDPGAIRMMHKAMLYDKAVTATKAKVEKLKSSPAKVSKPAPSGTNRSASNPASDAMARLRRSGSEADAESAFLASFGIRD